jgi:SAM-dependent methyltransferase
MRVTDRVRKTYEKYPFPQAGGIDPSRAKWQLAPLDWILAVWDPPPGLPRRVLVAGCGNGAEAFALARRLPDADIVGADFSPRSIAIARAMQKRSRRARHIRFVVADLTSPRFGRSIGEKFDFVSCHGVLSYVAQPERALENLAGCLEPDGALFLGVNGARHFSVGWRRALPAFGIEVSDFRESVRLREVLELFDAIAEHPRGRIARRSAEFLSSDLLCPLNRALPLAGWTRLCRGAGLHLLGSYSAHQALRPIVNGGLWRLLMPSSRAEVCEIIERINPSSFHKLVLSPRKPIRPPWDSPGKLLRWRPVPTGLYSWRSGKGRRSPASPRRLELVSRSTNTVAELRVLERDVEILGRADGARPLREILEPRSRSARQAASDWRETHYLLYLLAVINLRAPGQFDEM